MRIYYTKTEGAGFFPAEVDCQTNTIVRWLNKRPVNKPLLLCQGEEAKKVIMKLNLDGYMPACHNDHRNSGFRHRFISVPWTKDPIHCLMLPDGRQWDTHNGWRHLASKNQGRVKQQMEWGQRAYQTMEEQQERDNGKDSNQKES